MTALLKIGRLTLRGPVDAEPLLQAMQPRDDDRRVLLVRRVQLPRDDPLAAQQQLADLRRSAAHPASATVPSDAMAVEFADEVEALACLSRDLLAGTAHQHWWWGRRLARYAASRADELTELWTANPRLLPAVLASLAADRLGAEPAVAALGPNAPRVLAAVAAQFPAQYHSAAQQQLPENAELSDPRTQPSTAGLSSQPTTPAAELLINIAARVTGAPALLRRPVRTPEPAGAQPGTDGALRVPASETTADRSDGAASVLDEAPPDVTTLEPSGPAREMGSASGPPPAEPPVDPPAGSGSRPDTVADLDHERRLRRPAAPDAYEPDEVDTGEPPPPWVGSAPQLDTRLATMLYAVHLMRWYGLDELAEPPATGWAVVEALARALLDQLGDELRRKLRRDPLLPAFARLDGRDPEMPSPVVLGERLDPVRDWLAEHGVPPATFARPGVVYVSRTHVDVVLPLEGVDLIARQNGLDQDPGWVPELGRIVLFHFQET